MFEKNDRGEHPVEAPLLTGDVIRKFFEVSNIQDPAENTVRFDGQDVVAEDDSEYVNATKSFIQAVSNPDLGVDDIKDILETETTPLSFSAKLYFAAIATAKTIEEYNAGNEEIADADPTIMASDLNKKSEDAVASYRSPLYQGSSEGHAEARYTTVSYIDNKGTAQTKQVDITHVPKEYAALVKGDFFTNPEVPTDLLTQAMKFHAERDAARELFIFAYHKLLSLRGLISSEDTPADMSGVTKVLNWIRSENVGGMCGAVQNLYGTFQSYKDSLYGALDSTREKRKTAGKAPMVYENIFTSIAKKEKITNADKERILSDKNFVQTIQRLASVVMPVVGDKSNKDAQIKNIVAIPRAEIDEWVISFKELYKYTSVLQNSDKSAVKISFPVNRSGETQEKSIKTMYGTLTQLNKTVQDMSSKEIAASISDVGGDDHRLMQAFLNAILRYFDYYFAMANETLDDNFEALSSKDNKDFDEDFTPNPSDWTGDDLVGKDGTALKWGVRRKDLKAERLNSKEKLPDIKRISTEIETCLNAFSKKFGSEEATAKMTTYLTDPRESDVEKVINDYSPTRNVPDSIITDVEKVIEEMRPAAVFHLVKLNTPEEEFEELTLGESLNTGYDPYDDTHREHMDLEKTFSETKVKLDNASVELARMVKSKADPDAIEEKREEVGRLDDAVNEMSAKLRVENKNEVEHKSIALKARRGTIPLEDRDAVSWAAQGNNLSLLKGTSDKLTAEQKKSLKAAYASLSDYSTIRDGAQKFSGMNPKGLAKQFGPYKIQMARILHAWQYVILELQEKIRTLNRTLDALVHDEPDSEDIPKIRAEIEKMQEELRNVDGFASFIENSDPNDMAPAKQSLMSELRAIVKDLGEFVLQNYDRADISEEAKDEMIAEVDASISDLADRYGASKKELLKKAVSIASEMTFSEGTLVAHELNQVKDLLGSEETEGWEDSDGTEVIPEPYRNSELREDPEKPFIKPASKLQSAISGAGNAVGSETERNRLIDRAKKAGLIGEKSTAAEIDAAVAEMKQEVMREGLREEQLDNLDGIAYRPRQNVPLNPFQKLLQQTNRR
jgi:hypothetical protein